MITQQIQPPAWAHFIFSYDLFWRHRFRTVFDADGKRERIREPAPLAEWINRKLTGFVWEWLKEGCAEKITQSEYALDKKTGEKIYYQMGDIQSFFVAYLREQISEYQTHLKILRKKPRTARVQEKIDKYSARMVKYQRALYFVLDNPNLLAKWSLTRIKSGAGD